MQGAVDGRNKHRYMVSICWACCLCPGTSDGHTWHWAAASGSCQATFCQSDTCLCCGWVHRVGSEKRWSGVRTLTLPCRSGQQHHISNRASSAGICPFATGTTSCLLLWCSLCSIFGLIGFHLSHWCSCMTLSHVTNPCRVPVLKGQPYRQHDGPDQLPCCLPVISGICSPGFVHWQTGTGLCCKGRAPAEAQIQQGCVHGCLVLPLMHTWLLVHMEAFMYPEAICFQVTYQDNPCSLSALPVVLYQAGHADCRRC